MYTKVSTVQYCISEHLLARIATTASVLTGVPAHRRCSTHAIVISVDTGHTSAKCEREEPCYQHGGEMLCDVSTSTHFSEFLNLEGFVSAKCTNRSLLKISVQTMDNSHFLHITAIKLHVRDKTANSDGTQCIHILEAFTDVYGLIFIFKNFL